MPRTLEELAAMLAERDGLPFEEEMRTIRDCAAEMETAFFNGSLDEAEDILKDYLGLEHDYLDLFIF